MNLKSLARLLVFGVAPAPYLPSAAAQQASPAVRPPILVQADQDQIDYQVTVHSPDSMPTKDNFTTGLLTSTQAGFVARPVITLKGTPAAAAAGTGDYTVNLSIEALMPFGESSADLYYKGTQIDLLRFSRPGVAVNPATGTTIVARQPDLIFNPGPFLLVLDNHSSFAYKSVAARLRFQDHDLCTFEVDSPQQKSTKNSAADCVNESAWTKFALPQYNQVTLRATDLPGEWFQSPGSSYARSGKSVGTLTLHFSSSASNGIIHEQNLPLEVQFEPSTMALARTLIEIFILLTLGAAVSYLLRVSLPNMKRKRALKDQLIEMNKSITGLSSRVDSRLRTLLDCESLALDELRTEVYPIAPNYADYAKRVEQGLPVLSRKVAIAQRLGSALERHRSLIVAGYPYLPLREIDRLLQTVSRQLQKDQIGDDDWTAIEQTLKKAEGMLEDEDQPASDTSNADLAKRWQSLREHFGPRDQGALGAGPWAPPDAIKDLKPFFDTLPREFFATSADAFKQWIGDEDGTGGVADILVSGLEYASYLETIVPPKTPSAVWKSERENLCDLFSNLTTQKLFDVHDAMWRLSENIFKEDIKQALSAGHARLIADPENPSLNQSFRISVRFFDSRLDEATARNQLNCRWTLTTAMTGSRKRLKPWELKASTTAVKHEQGWHTFHYFENRSVSVAISIEVSDEVDKVTVEGASQEFPAITLAAEPNRNRKEKRSRTILEIAQLSAALLVPLAALASSTINGGSEGPWWSLVALGFGTDTIKNIISGKDDTAAPAK